MLKAKDGDEASSRNVTYSRNGGGKALFLKFPW